MSFISVLSFQAHPEEFHILGSKEDKKKLNLPDSSLGTVSITHIVNCEFSEFESDGLKFISGKISIFAIDKFIEIRGDGDSKPPLAFELLVLFQSSLKEALHLSGVEVLKAYSTTFIVRFSSNEPPISKIFNNIRANILKKLTGDIQLSTSYKIVQSVDTVAIQDQGTKNLQKDLEEILASQERIL
jgi:hypothetical protein